jgi:NAD(P)H-flavin reductase/ferredoxin
MTAPLGKSDAAAAITVASSGHAFACDPGQTLLMAGLAAGLELPYECASGSCGSCRCKLVEGELLSLWPGAPGLSERDRRRGNIILMCQSVPAGDCVIDVKVRGPRSLPRPLSTVARIAGIRPLTHNMVEMSLQVDTCLAYLPGQFVLVELPGRGRRAYSMANVDDGCGRLDLIIKVKEDGAISPVLCRRLRVGDCVGVEGPYGAAYFRSDGDRPVVGIAGGSGIAPIWAIAQAAAHGGARDVHLYFGVNALEDVCLAEEFTRLARANERVRTHNVVMDPAALPHRTGLVGDAVITDLPDLHHADIYMAGPPAMIDDLARRLVGENRIDCDRLFFDRFA